jgi:hypothetical protein
MTEYQAKGDVRFVEWRCDDTTGNRYKVRQGLQQRIIGGLVES